MQAAELAARIDHTILAPHATSGDVRAACREAVNFGCAAICVHGGWVPVACAETRRDVRVCAVAGFPSGAMATAAKCADAFSATSSGADEIDVVMNLGLLRGGEESAVLRDIAAVRSAIPREAILKVIIESAALDADEIGTACLLAVRAGAEYVKTSTGFHPAGGASLEAVRVMRAAIGGRARIKASGGIRSFEAAREMLEAGADRLGVSRTGEVLSGAP